MVDSACPSGKPSSDDEDKDTTEMPNEHEDSDKLTTIVKSRFEIIDDFVCISTTHHDIDNNILRS